MIFFLHGGKVAMETAAPPHFSFSVFNIKAMVSCVCVCLTVTSLNEWINTHHPSPASASSSFSSSSLICSLLSSSSSSAQSSPAFCWNVGAASCYVAGPLLCRRVTTTRQTNTTDKNKGRRGGWGGEEAERLDRALFRRNADTIKNLWQSGWIITRVKRQQKGRASHSSGSMGPKWDLMFGFSPKIWKSWQVVFPLFVSEHRKCREY